MSTLADSDEPDERVDAPFAAHALTIFDSGLGEVFPVLPGTKKPVTWDKPADDWDWGGRTPDGKHSVTARKHPTIDREHVERWTKEFPDHMIGIVPDDQIVIIDVDQHGKKRGAQNLARALGFRKKSELGLLLKGTLHVSGRPAYGGWSGAHGHWYYYVPEGIRLKRSLPEVPDVGIIGPGRAGFYTVAPGSVHPETGRVYTPDVAGVSMPIENITRDLIQPMPKALLDLYADTGERSARPDGGLWEDAEQYANDPWGVPDEALQAVLDEYLEDTAAFREKSNHHESALAVQVALAQLAEDGHSGCWTAMDQAREAAESYFESEGRGGEFGGGLRGVTVDLERMQCGQKTGDWSYLDPALRLPPLMDANGEPIKPTTRDSLAGGRVNSRLQTTLKLITNGKEIRSAQPPDEDRFSLLDLTSLLDPDRPPRRWFLDGVVPIGDHVSIVAPGGTGKSLFALALSIAAVRGHGEFCGMKIDLRDGGKIMYIDKENSGDDWVERLNSFGVTMEETRHWVDRFFPLSFPKMRGLDTAAGAEWLLDALDHFEIGEGDVLVLDSTQRLTEGEENDNDTIRQFYNHTAEELKRRGLTVIRTDNTGKEVEKGARGASAKNDDVGYSWLLERRGKSDVFTLKNTKFRGLGSGAEIKFRVVVEDGRTAFMPLIESATAPGSLSALDKWQRDHFRIAAVEVLRRAHDAAVLEGTSDLLSQSEVLRRINTEEFDYFDPYKQQVERKKITFRKTTGTKWLGELVDEKHIRVEGGKEYTTQTGETKTSTKSYGFLRDLPEPEPYDPDETTDDVDSY